MFWRKKPEEPLKPKVENLPRPKEIPELVGRNLVVEKKRDPDSVWKLKAVMRKRLEEGKDIFDVRIFDEAQVSAKKLTVKDYNSLDEHPDSMLHEAWFDKKSMKVQIKERESVKESGLRVKGSTMAEKKEEKRRRLRQQNRLLYHSHQSLQRDDRAKDKSLFRYPEYE